MGKLNKQERVELTVKLNGMEQRLKRTPNYKIWNEYVKKVFKAVEVYSFEELINKNAFEANDLINQFKNIR